MKLFGIINKVVLSFFLLELWVQDAFAIYTDFAEAGDGSTAQFGGGIKMVLQGAGLVGVIMFVGGCFSAYNAYQMGGRGGNGGGYGKAITMCVVGVCLCTVYGAMRLASNTVLGGADMHVVEQMGLGN